MMMMQSIIVFWSNDVYIASVMKLGRREGGGGGIEIPFLFDKTIGMSLKTVDPNKFVRNWGVTSENLAT